MSKTIEETKKEIERLDDLIKELREDIDREDNSPRLFQKFRRLEKALEQRAVLGRFLEKLKQSEK